MERKPTSIPIPEMLVQFGMDRLDHCILSHNFNVNTIDKKSRKSTLPKYCRSGCSFVSKGKGELGHCIIAAAITLTHPL